MFNLDNGLQNTIEWYRDFLEMNEKANATTRTNFGAGF